jgi:hypothetical protein
VARRCCLALERYAFLTANQLTRLLYAPGSRSYAQARLKRLADAGYLQRVFLPRPTRTGSAPLVYTLARKGHRALEAWGSTARRRNRPAGARAASYLHLLHTLALNDFLLALELFCGQTPRVQLAGLRHERELRRDPTTVRLADGAPTAVIPDAWVDLRLDERFQECYVVELDRGTSGQRAWRGKVAALLAYADGPYQRAFGTASLTVAVVAVTGARRRDTLVAWTLAELVRLGREDAAGLFRLAGVNPAVSPPATLFTGAIWRMPGVTAAEPLLDLSYMGERRDGSDAAADSSISVLSVNTDDSVRSEISEISETAYRPWDGGEEQCCP